MRLATRISATRISRATDDAEIDELVQNQVVATITAEMAALGFVPDQALVGALRSLEDERLGPVCRELLDALANQVGAHRTFKPLYPDFPLGVINRWRG